MIDTMDSPTILKNIMKVMQLLTGFQESFRFTLYLDSSKQEEKCS